MTTTDVLYLAPWVDYGGSDKGTIDWFRWLDRDRFAATLVTTQPSDNRRLGEVVPYAREVWALPDMLAARDFPKTIFDLLDARQIDVLHIMNSRLGYELLPDLACLDRPPKVVVQLHVEEADKSGYVRYVTTRFGNLVDAFSVTSHHLAAAVRGYGVSPDRIRVIHTGVDAEREFSPERVTPVGGLEGGGVRILYPGRLVEQKDPLLMVEVIAALAERTTEFTIDVVGEGDLEPAVRRAVADRGLSERVRFHPATSQLAPWYAASDVLLMTSVFEGVPYVVYEAMAMALPIVAPALVGNVELLGADHPGLIDPREDVQAYAAALATLVEQAAARKAAGAELRERVLTEFSLERMAREHEQLYADVLDAPAVAAVRDVHAAEHAAHEREERPAVPDAIDLLGRPSLGRPAVSVIVPCFNAGRLILEAVESARAQEYPEVEIVVADDGSTESETLAALGELEAAEDVHLIRMPVNGGPSAARNAAIEQSFGRYLLCLDADNVLLPGAIDALVAQLQSAGAQVGFIYPNLKFFGNRTDYFRAPTYNLHRLMQENFCDTGSLFDRAIFDAGERFPEDIKLGHEDWDFMLSLAARGVYGEAAVGPTLRYRKWGFNRSDSVEYLPEAFHESVRDRHPRLYGASAAVKATWAPGVTLIALDPIPDETERGRVARRLAGQSCQDLQMVCRFDGAWPADQTWGHAPVVRRMPVETGSDHLLPLEAALQDTESPVVGITRGTGSQVLADRAIVEKTLRIFGATDVEAVCLVDAGAEGGHPFRLLRDPKLVVARGAHTLFVKGEALDSLPGTLAIGPRGEIDALVYALIAAGVRLQWRHSEGPADPRWSPPVGATLHLRHASRAVRRQDQAERESRREALPIVPGIDPGVVPRWGHAHTYAPSASTILSRHRALDGSSRFVSLERTPPPGFELEYDLGFVRVFPLQGTSRLVSPAQGHYEVVDREAPREDGIEELGYLEDAAFPLLDALVLGTHLPTGQPVLVCGPDDPLAGEVAAEATLGWLESVPINPRTVPDADPAVGVAGLVRTVDSGARRHRYGIGSVPGGELVGELGAVLTAPAEGTKPVWVTPDGRIVVAQAAPGSRRSVSAALKWVGAPISWHGVATATARRRAVARRGLQAVRAEAGTRTPRPDSLRDAAPAGYLFSEDGPRRVPLFESVHPITGDQLITRSQEEATDMGYVAPQVVGYALRRAPLTENLNLRRVSVPWASRFGSTARIS